MSVKIDFIGERTRDRKNIAIVHGKVKIDAKRLNLEFIRRIIRIASAYSVRVTILPPYFNTGPILEYSDLSKKRYTKRRFEQVSDHTIQVLRRLALLESTSIIVPAFLEKAGAHYYVSSLFIGRDGSLKYRYKKIVLSDIESQYNIVSGREVNVFASKIFNFGVVINDEILYPELFKLYRVQGCNFFLVALNPLVYKYYYVSYIARSRVRETYSPIALIGSIIEYHKVEGGAPTVIYDSDGDMIYEYNGLDPKIIIINPDNIHINELGPTEYARIRDLGKLLSKTLRKMDKNARKISLKQRRWVYRI